MGHFKGILMGCYRISVDFYTTLKGILIGVLRRILLPIDGFQWQYQLQVLLIKHLSMAPKCSWDASGHITCMRGGLFRVPSEVIERNITEVRIAIGCNLESSAVKEGELECPSLNEYHELRFRSLTPQQWLLLLEAKLTCTSYEVARCPVATCSRKTFA